jgi:acylphosphatase
MSACRFLIEGRVQGVGYRYFALKAAEALGVTGFARNLPDGRVEVIAEGSDQGLAAFETKLREGPGFSEVRGLVRSEIPERGSTGFHVR